MYRYAPLVLLPVLAACSTIVPRTTADISPAGQTLRVVASGGIESQMQFRSNGQVVAAANGRSFTGDWALQQEGLCFRWGTAPVECWPYNRKFERGRTVSITSTRGNVVQVTRL
jgi:hypothetical protein